jgi:hypothetical protein
MTLALRALPSRPPVVGARLEENATLISRRDLSERMASFSVSLDTALPTFLPGQYVSLGLKDGQRFIQRPYSIASPPGDRRIWISSSGALQMGRSPAASGWRRREPAFESGHRRASSHSTARIRDIGCSSRPEQALPHSFRCWLPSADCPRRLLYSSCTVHRMPLSWASGTSSTNCDGRASRSSTFPPCREGIRPRHPRGAATLVASSRSSLKSARNGP